MSRPLTEEEREALEWLDSGAYSCSHGEERCPSLPCRNDRDDLYTTVERIIAAREAALAERIAVAIEELHKPIRVYDECEHDADHGCEPVEVYDYMGCTESVIGWGCSTCCYDYGEYPREDCPHGADHQGVSEADSCPTSRIARSFKDGERS